MELTDTQHNVLVAMLQQSLDRKGEYAYPVRDDWKWVDGKRVDIPAATSWEEGERIKLAQVDGDALVEAGMVEYIDSGTLRYQLTPEGICYGLPHVTGYTPLDPKTGSTSWMVVRRITREAASLVTPVIMGASLRTRQAVTTHRRVTDRFLRKYRWSNRVWPL